MASFVMPSSICILAFLTTSLLFVQCTIPEKFQNTTAIINNYSNSTNSSRCITALMNIANDRSSLERYIDATGEPESGILIGNMAWLGSYKECVMIPDAHYCLSTFLMNITNVTIPGDLPVSIRWGLCVPKECSSSEVASGLKEILEILGLQSKLIISGKGEIMNPDPRGVVCAAPSKYTPGVIVALVICAIILLLCLMGTVAELVQIYIKQNLDCGGVSAYPVEEGKTIVNTQATDDETFCDKKNLIQHQSKDFATVVNGKLSGSRKENICLKFLLCFSLIRNTRRIMDTNVPPGAITSLNGIRVMSMWWVILGHTFIWLVWGGNVSNLLDLLPVLQRFSFQAIANAVFSVDSFFFLSGLLVTYLSLRHMERRGGLPWFKFYFHRFWRLTPSYMFVILFYNKLMGFLGQGPIWFTQQADPGCDKFWWTNLLYINNFYGQERCIGWSWYLANDMQFYVISPIMLYAIYKFRVVGCLVSVGTFFIAHFVTTGTLIGYYNMSVTLLGSGKDFNRVKDFQDDVYDKPYCRIGPYLVGIILGYLLHAQKNRTRKLPLGVVLGGWSIAITLAMLVVYGPYSILKKGGKPFNKAENITYGTFSRTAWAIALGWVVYACQTGYAGLVDNILSARFWIPLSRLTYSAYLVHPIVLYVFFDSNPANVSYTDTNIAIFYVGVTVMSYAAAFILAVCVEFPTMQLEKVLFKTHDR